MSGRRGDAEQPRANRSATRRRVGAESDRRTRRRVLVPLCLLCMRRAERGVALCLYCGGSVLLFDD
jgi:hypothetical protein